MPRNKYGAKKTTVDGHTFASKREAKRYAELRLLQKAGEISGLELQPRFHFVIDGKPVKMRNGQEAKYTADFMYLERGRIVVEEVKGYIVRDYPLRIAIIKALYPDIEFREIK